MGGNHQLLCLPVLVRAGLTNVVKGVIRGLVLLEPFLLAFGSVISNAVYVVVFVVIGMMLPMGALFAVYMKDFTLLRIQLIQSVF